MQELTVNFILFKTFLRTTYFTKLSNFLKNTFTNNQPGPFLV